MGPMPKGKRGRPPLDPNDRSVSVHVKMSAKQYDDTYARARQERIGVPELIRRAMAEAREAEKKKQEN
jgi:hypothetical protein